MPDHKTVIIPQSVLDKHRGKALTHKELDLLCHENRIDFTIEHLYKKIPIEKIAHQYNIEKEKIDFIVSSFSEIVNKYIVNMNNLINLQSVDIRFPIELKLKSIIECVDNLISAQILSNRYGIPISNIYKWVSIFKENKNKENFNSVKSSFIKSNYHHVGGHEILKPRNSEKNNMEYHEEKNKKSTRKRLSQKEKLVILKDYFNSDLNITELSKKFNTSVFNIIRWRDDYLSDKKNTMFIEKMKVIAKDYFNGNLNKEFLKQKYAIKEEKIFEWSKKFNLLKNNDVKQKFENDVDLRNKIVDEYMNSDLAMREIAKKHRVSLHYISNWKQSKHYKEHVNKNKNNDKNKVEFKNKNSHLNEDSGIENKDSDALKELERQKIKNDLLMDIIKELSRGHLKKSS